MGQYTDYFESYTPGEPIFVNWWGSWSGTETDALLAIESTAFNGAVSGYAPSNQGVNSVLSLGNKTEDIWQLEMFFFIPEGSSASWNLQEQAPVAGGQSIVGDFLFNDQGNTPGQAKITDTTIGEVSFSFPHDQWFRMTLNFNFFDGAQSPIWGVFIDGEIILDNGTPFSDLDGNYPVSLGGVNFKSTTIGDGYLLDRFLFCDTSCLLGTNSSDPSRLVEFYKTANGLHFRTAPPTTKVLVYDLHGRLMHQASPRAGSFSIPYSTLQRGIYIVELQIDGQRQRVKVLL